MSWNRRTRRVPGPARRSAVLAAVLLAACSAPAPAPTPAPRPAPSGRTGLDDFVRRQMRTMRVPGMVVGVVVGDTVGWLKAYTAPGLETADSLTIDAVFKAGGATPAVNALAAAYLEAVGTLDLDAPVGAYFPDLADELQAATMAQLLTHTAGLTAIPAVAGRQGKNTLFEAAHYLFPQDRMTRPGAIYSYSPPGLMLAGYVMERTVGGPYEAVVADAVLRPLRMSRATLRFPGDSALAPLYGPAEADALGPGLTVRPPAPESALAVPVRGLHASAPDLVQLMRALLNDGEVDGVPRLPPGVVAAALRPRATTPDGRPVALAGVLETWEDRALLVLDSDREGHGMALRLLPDDRIGVVVLASRYVPALGRIADFVFRRLLDLPDREPRTPQTRTTEPRPPFPPERVVGEYWNGGEQLVLGLEAGQLRLRSGNMVLDVHWRNGRYHAVIPDGRTALEFDMVADDAGRLYIWLGAPGTPYSRETDRALARDPT